ncbi:MAG: AAA family ATPase [Clostridia bacterium]|nr:AAA family ATPase [Clostridia bacterium]
MVNNNNEYSYNQIFNNLISNIPLKKSEKLYGITFVGGPGYGKSTIAKMLSSKLDIYSVTNDEIRRLYESLGFSEEKYSHDIKKMGYDRRVYLLKNKTSHILDVNMEFAWERAINSYQSLGAKLLFIELVCSEGTILRRIKEREESFNQNDNYSRATDQDYYKYLELKKNNQNQIPPDMIFYSIDTDKSIDEIEKQVELLIKKIEEI